MKCSLPYILPIEIWQEILEYVDFLSQIRLRQICKHFYEYLHITNFYYNMINKHVWRLSDEILKQHPHIKNLWASIERKKSIDNR